MNDRQRERIRLMQGSLTYRDDRLTGFDAVTSSSTSSRTGCRPSSGAVIEFARPNHVVVTTPNSEYNGQMAENSRVPGRRSHGT